MDSAMVMPMVFWKYRQLSAIDSLPKPFRDDLTQIEFAFVEDQPVERPISYFYKALPSLSASGTPAFLLNWDKDLHKELLKASKKHNLAFSAYTFNIF